MNLGTAIVGSVNGRAGTISGDLYVTGNADFESFAGTLVAAPGSNVGLGDSNGASVVYLEGASGSLSGDMGNSSVENAGSLRVFDAQLDSFENAGTANVDRLFATSSVLNTGLITTDGQIGGTITNRGVISGSGGLSGAQVLNEAVIKAEGMTISAPYVGSAESRIEGPGSILFESEYSDAGTVIAGGTLEILAPSTAGVVEVEVGDSPDVVDYRWSPDPVQFQGVLRVITDPARVFRIGESFDVVLYGARMGTFEVYEGMALEGGGFLEPLYDDERGVLSLVARGLNAAPVAVADTAETPEDTAVTVDVLANDTDADGDDLVVVGIPEQPTNGAAAVQNGEVVYFPGPNFVGTDVFSYTVSDGTLTAFGEVTVTVGGRNDAPVAVDDAVSTPEDVAVVVQVLANDSDPDDGSALAVAAVTQPAHGTATLGDDGAVTYTPEADFNGTDEFTYTVDDGQGPVGSPTGLRKATSTATVRVTVTPVNDAPLARDDVASTGEDNPVSVAVLSNDTDIDGDALSVIAAGGASFGQVAISGGTAVIYTPTAGFTGQDSFLYTVSDGNGGSSQARVSVTVSDLAPVARDDAAATVEDTAVSIDVLANDESRVGEPLAVASVSGASNGTVSVESGGTVLYTPEADFSGQDTFTYVTSDAGGSASGTVTVTVTPVNDAPSASVVTAPNGTLMISGDQGTPVPLAWSAATDPDGDAVDYRWELGSTASFATTLLTVTSSTTSAETTYGALADALATIGVGAGESVEVFQRVVSSDGALETAGTALALTIERGVMTAGEGSAPLAFDLSSAAPNPTRGALTVLVDLPLASTIHVEVFDLLGRKMHEMEAHVAAGRDVAVPLDLSTLQPGIYAYRVTAPLPAGEEVRTGRVTLVR